MAKLCLSARKDRDFWCEWPSRKKPDTLAEKLSIYQSQGYLRTNESNLFEFDSWYAVLSGMGHLPKDYTPLVDSSNIIDVKEHMKRVEQSLAHSENQLKSHKDYLKEFLEASQV